MIEKQSKVILDPLIQLQYNEEEEEEGGLKRQVFNEVKKQMILACPLIAVSFLQFSLEMISIMFVGHLGQLQLSSAAMATCFASSTGFCVLLGMGGALETLCGQAYGAKQYHMLGIQMQRGMIVLTAVSIPLAFLWFYTTTIFVALGQDEEISNGAGIFISWMIPTLFAYGLLQCLTRFLQTQNIVLPMMIISGITALFHIFLSWLLVYRLGLEIMGAALANAISNWINVVMFGMYVMFSPSCRHTWTGFSKEALHDLLSFFKLAVPSAVMTCFEYWSFDMVVLLSGFLPNPMLETSVLAISLDTCFMVYNITLGLGGAISTRVSNELGAGRPKAARLAVCVSVVIAILEGIIVVAISILLRHVWGKVFSNDEEVIKYVARMIPLLALTDFLDGFQCVLSGAARGCGWQNVCAITNLGAYYGVGIPCALVLAFVLDVGGMGLWMGITCALSVQVVVLIAINLSTNWTNEARKAISRVESSLGIE